MWFIQLPFAANYHFSRYVYSVISSSAQCALESMTISSIALLKSVLEAKAEPGKRGLRCLNTSQNRQHLPKSV